MPAETVTPASDERPEQTVPERVDHLAVEREADVVARRVTHARVVRNWARHSVVYAVIALLVLGFVAWTWDHGEFRHAHSHPSAIKAKAVPTGQLPTTLTAAWHTTDRAAIGDALDLDVLVTYGGHTVSGRDARTGTVRWTYTRTDRRLCTALVAQETVMAVYAHDGICDEATGLDQISGRRVWTRTLLGSQPVTMTTGDDHYLFVRPDIVYLVRPYHPEPTDEFQFKEPAGCVSSRAVVGSQGVLIANRCTTASTLTLFAPDSTGNWKQTWQVPLGGRTPLSAGSQLVTLAADGRSLQLLDVKKGGVTGTLRLARAAVLPSAASPVTVELPESEMLLLTLGGGRSVAISTGGRPSVAWDRNGATLSETAGGLDAARAGAVYSVTPTDGRERRIATAPGLTAAARLFVLGRGVLADSANGVTAYH